MVSVTKADMDGHGCDGVRSCAQWAADFAKFFFTTSKVKAAAEPAVVNQHFSDPKAGLADGHVRVAGVAVEAKADGLKSSVAVSAYAVKTDMTFSNSSGNVKGTVTNNFATADASASLGESGNYKVEATAKLSEWGGSLDVLGLKVEGSICLVCAGGSASGSWQMKSIKGEADLVIAGASLGVSYQGQSESVKAEEGKVEKKTE